MNFNFDSEDLSYRYVVGIDLGTTNSALAFVDLTKSREQRRIQFLDIPQLVAPGEMRHRSVLPSFLYLPGAYELSPGSTALPWDQDRNYVVGEFAREQGARIPGRLVTSAKSWMSHGGVDRTGPILPWGSGSDVQKVSPVLAASRYLQHLREAWNEEIGRGREGFRLEEQRVVLTVPASFDEVARELTVTAAREAGLPRVILLEEPLAAFYAWLSNHERDWRDQMQAGQLILVCDVGGGTTDFTLVAIREGEAGLRFDRLAVGEHLMLGGDNMDLSLARHIEVQLLGEPGKLDSQRWHQLWHQCRQAKEVLLGGVPLQGGGKKDSVEITLMGAGRKLIADTLKARLHRSDVEHLILDGFFPFVPVEDHPQGGRRLGLTEWGLPFVQDPAVTRHLAQFWSRYRTLLHQETGRSVLYPDFLLFNGGALTPSSIRNRILAVAQSWFQEEAGHEWSPIELENPRPELSVAIGAAYYGLVRMGEGVRVGAGSPRAYYVEAAAGANAEAEPGTRKTVCLVPRGTEEGFEVQLQQPSFEVLANQPVAFQLFSSNTRLGDHLGDVVWLPDEESTALPPIRTVLRYGKKGVAQTLPVQLAIRLTEVGTLELWCQSLQSPHRWQLQFDVRQEARFQESALVSAPEETLDTKLIEEAQSKIEQVFQRGGASAEHTPERLIKDLTGILDIKKERWSSSLIRKLADTLLHVKAGRTLSAQHEARWFNLLGFCLRPGFGDPLDEWRIKEVWKLYPAGLSFPRQPQARTEWWIFWRRVAGGLSAGQQWHVYQQVAPSLNPQDRKKKKDTRALTKHLSAPEELEIWMTLANFERLPAVTKAELGRLVLERIRKGKPSPKELWALSRFGARVPFYGPLDQVVPGTEASPWLKAILDLNLEVTEGLAQTLVQLARRTGDRERDLPQEDRDRLFEWLARLPRGKRLQAMLTEPSTILMSQEKDWIFGEALPAGLIVS